MHNIHKHKAMDADGGSTANRNESVLDGGKRQLGDHQARTKVAGGGKHINFIAWKLTEIVDVSGFSTVANCLLVEVIVNRIKLLKIKNKS